MYGLVCEFLPVRSIQEGLEVLPNCMCHGFFCVKNKCLYFPHHHHHHHAFCTHFTENKTIKQLIRLRLNVYHCTNWTFNRDWECDQCWSIENSLFTVDINNNTVIALCTGIWERKHKIRHRRTRCKQRLRKETVNSDTMPVSSKRSCFIDISQFCSFDKSCWIHPIRKGCKKSYNVNAFKFGIIHICMSPTTNLKTQK